MARDKTRRGSPEAIAKRRSARALNTLFERDSVTAAMDGRSVRRKHRLKRELGEGRRGQPLKAHEVLSHATELLNMGETLASIRRLKPLVPPTPPLTDATVAAIRATQQSYGFDPRAWKVLGVDIEPIMNGSAPAKPGTRQRGRAKARATTKK